VRSAAGSTPATRSYPARNRPDCADRALGANDVDAPERDNAERQIRACFRRIDVVIIELGRPIRRGGKAMIRRCAFVAPYLLIVASALGLVSASPAAAKQSAFTIVTQHAHYNKHSDSVTFTVVFNRQPNFITTDAIGHQEESFQYFIVGDPNLPYPSNYDAIIRGDEIHLTQNSIRIRNGYPPDYADPHSGGWGTIRGTVPFTIHGHVLRFTTALSLISDHSNQPTISYRLESYEFGVGTSSFEASIRL
jgi:hypothetical protein